MNREVDFQFLKEHIDSGATFLLDVYAKWCHPCKLLEKELDTLLEKNADLEIVRLDYDSNTEIADFLGIGSLPYILIFKEGKQVGKIKGFHRAELLLEEVSKCGL